MLSSTYKVRIWLTIVHGCSIKHNFARKIAQHQIAQDDAVRALVKDLREMAGAANSYTDPREIPDTINVIEEIGRASFEAAMLVHDYTHPSIQGRAKFLGI